MPAIKKFEDLDIWQLARRLAQIIYTYTLRPDFAKDFSLKDQIKRSSGSVMDNIAEGFERGGKAEFIQFLSIAKGSSRRSSVTIIQGFGLFAYFQRGV